jgi:hypothetical protein
MSNAWLADFDAIAHSAFADAGIADTALLRTPQGVEHGEVRCMVTRGVQNLTDLGSVTSPETLVDLLREDLPAGVSAGWQLQLGAELFVLDGAHLSSDESLIRYAVRAKR